MVSRRDKAVLGRAKDDPFYPVFVLMLLFGLRRGEALGLRWIDLDEDDGVIRVRQQVQRIGKNLIVGPVKTKAGRRDLPLISAARDAIKKRRDEQDHDRQVLGEAWTDNGLIFTTRSGRPIEPSNLRRTFNRLCDQNTLRRITIHHLRHTVASLLKKQGVPARDAQMILGHSRITVTQEIYTQIDLGPRPGGLPLILIPVRLRPWARSASRPAN